MKEQKVVFRKFSDGDVIALFCDTAKDCNPGHVMSYMHLGQHGEASRYLGRDLKLASPAEYAPLFREMSRIYAPEFRIVPVDRLRA